MKLISYVLPVYNEEQLIDKLYAELSATIDKIKDKYAVEVLFINDGSSDKTLEKLKVLHKTDPKLKILNFSRNFGHQAAITAGIDHAKGDAIIIMDSDLQDPPEVSLELISKWESGYDVVYAQRSSRVDSFSKQLTANIFYKLLNRLSEVHIPSNVGDFRLIDRKVANELKKLKEHSRFMRGLVSFVGFQQTGVTFDRPNRPAGETKYPFKKMLGFALDGITGFSTKPLKVITRIGFFVSGLSFLGILYALAARFFFPEYTVAGWTFSVISILFIGGIQIVTLGIIGSYIGRIYHDVQDRPLYIVSEVVESDDSAYNPPTVL